MEEGIHIREFVNKVITILNDCNVEYMLVGGIAAVHYGRPRSTMDCDIVISLKEDELKFFCQCLKSKGFEIREHDLIMGFKEKSHFNAYLEGYPYRVDFSWKDGSMASLSEYGFKRSKNEEVFGVKTRIEAPEDLIIAKLVFGSEQDFKDAATVFSEQKNNMDLKYLKRRAEEEGVMVQLEKLLKEAGA